MTCFRKDMCKYYGTDKPEYDKICNMCLFNPKNKETKIKWQQQKALKRRQK